MISVQLVEYIVIGVIALLVLLNVLLGFNKLQYDTINVIIKNWASNRYFFITFFWGVLGGHFFLGSRRALFGENWWLPVIIVAAIVIIMFFIGKRFKADYVLPKSYQIALLISGVLYGHFVWSQRHIPSIDFPW